MRLGKSLETKEGEEERTLKTAMAKLAKCPVCGFRLGFLPWGEFGNTASHEICPCCGIEFGFHDDALLDDPKDREKVWNDWRKRWIKEGMRWHSKSKAPPENWDQIKQLKDAQLATDSR